MSGYLGGQGGALSSVGRTGFAPAVSGGYRSQGGVQTPIELLSPQQRAAGGVGSALDYLRAGPASLAVQNLVGGFGRNIASWFGGGNTPTNTGYQPPEVNQPTNFGMSGNFSQPPRRYSDLGYY